MAIIITNEFKDVSKIFKGYLTIQDGTNLKQFDQLLELEINSKLELAAHYSSQKQKNNAVVGQSSSSTIKFDDTVTEYGIDGDNDETLLTEMTKKINNELEAVKGTFESVQETDSSDANNFIIHKFIGDIFNIVKTRDSGSGTHTTQMFIDITKQEHNKIASSAPTVGT